MNLSTFILLFVFSINVLLLFFILIHKQKQRFFQVFVIVFLISIWQGIELFILLFLLDKDNSLLWMVRAGLLPALYFAPAFVQLAYSMFNKWNKLSKWQQWAWWIPAVLMSPFVFTKYNVSDLVVSQERVFYVPGVLYWFFAFYFATLMIYGLYILIVNRKKSNQIVKRQIDYIFIATAITAIAGIFSGILLPLFGFINTYYMAVNSAIFFTVILTYALFHYRFFDLRTSIYHIFFDLVGLFLTAIIFYAFYFLLQDITTVDFDRTVNILYLFLFIGLTAPIVFGLMNKMLEFLLTNPSNNITKAEDSIAMSLRSESDINISLAKLAHQVGKVIDYNDLYIYLTKIQDQDIFHQVFPVGERSIDSATSLFIKHLEDNRGILNVAEVFYFDKDRELINELANTDIDVILPIYYNQKLLGLMIIDNGHKLLSVQQLNFLQQVNKYLDISIGGFLLYQQALIRRNIFK